MEGVACTELQAVKQVATTTKEELDSAEGISEVSKLLAKMSKELRNLIK